MEVFAFSESVMTSFAEDDFVLAAVVLLGEVAGSS